MTGSFVGGALSDRASRRFCKAPDGRMAYAVMGLSLIPLGCVGFGFSLANEVNIAVPLISMMCIGFGRSMYMASVMGLVSILKQSNAASAGSVMSFVGFVGAALVIAVADAISEYIGFEYFFLLVAGIMSISVLWIVFDLYSLGIFDDILVLTVEGLADCSAQKQVHSDTEKEHYDYEQVVGELHSH